jgi:hypothetical protein
MSIDTKGPNMNVEDPWYTLSSAAAFLGIDKSYMKKLYSKGRIYGKRMTKDRTLMFHIDDLSRMKYGKITRKV